MRLACPLADHANDRPNDGRTSFIGALTIVSFECVFMFLGFESECGDARLLANHGLIVGHLDERTFWTLGLAHDAIAVVQCCRGGWCCEAEWRILGRFDLFTGRLVVAVAICQHRVSLDIVALRWRMIRGGTRATWGRRTEACSWRYGACRCRGSRRLGISLAIVRVIFIVWGSQRILCSTIVGRAKGGQHCLERIGCSGSTIKREEWIGCELRSRRTGWACCGTCGCRAGAGTCPREKLRICRSPITKGETSRRWIGKEWMAWENRRRWRLTRLETRLAKERLAIGGSRSRGGKRRVLFAKETRKWTGLMMTQGMRAIERWVSRRQYWRGDAPHAWCIWIKALSHRGAGSCGFLLFTPFCPSILKPNLSWKNKHTHTKTMIKNRSINIDFVVRRGVVCLSENWGRRENCRRVSDGGGRGRGLTWTRASVKSMRIANSSLQAAIRREKNWLHNQLRMRMLVL